MDQERWKQIETAIEREEAEAEVEGGHNEAEGGSQIPPAEEPDELTAQQTRDGGETAAGIEVESGAAPAIREVEGFFQGEGRVAERSIVRERQAVVEAAEALEVVHGADDRVRVWGTTAYPWRTICHLYIVAQNGRVFGGTGAFIGPRVVLTAGHCVYLHGDGGWARSITVTPGRNASSQPYGSVVATQYRSVQGWTNGPNSNYDYGVIILPGNQSLGNTVGWMGLANLSFWSLLGLNVNTSGYPGDKPYGTQWWNSNNILAVTDRRLYYRIDTYGGQSGSPVWRYSNGQRHIVGIHTTGASLWNGATRICSPVFNNLVAWKNL